MADIAAIARQVRIDSLEMTYTAGCGHPGGSLSMAEVGAVLFFEHLKVDPNDPRAPDRDRFILSKGHCSPGHYSLLQQRGFFPREELAGFRAIDRLLQGHSDRKVPGVEMSAGSLGMGLSFGNGIEMARQMRGADFRTYVMLGDGELQEGQIWEAAMGASHRGLQTRVIVDWNGLQIDGTNDEVKSLGDLPGKWRSFGWTVFEGDGHDIEGIRSTLKALDEVAGPAVFLAHTIKGKGVSFMENQAKYHGMCLSQEEQARARVELAVSKEEMIPGGKA